PLPQAGEGFKQQRRRTPGSSDASGRIAIADRVAAFAAEGATRKLWSGGRLLPLPFAAAYQLDDPVDCRGVESRRDDVLARLFEVHVAAQDRVEHVVGRQRVLVGLVVAQFRGRRPRDHARRDHRRATHGVAPLRQAIDLGLVQVLDRRVAAAHVAVDRGVADRVLALVAGGEQQATELVRQRHHQRAARARLQVFLGGVGGAFAEGFGQRVEEAAERLLDRQGQQRQAERVALVLRQIVRLYGGVTRLAPPRDDSPPPQYLYTHRPPAVVSE